MQLFFIIFISTIINYLLITTLADVILMGKLSLHFDRSCDKENFLITKENHADFQTGLMCSAFSSAYVLRHWEVEASGETLYTIMPNKMKAGYVYPKGIKKLLTSYGFSVKYCRGNLNALKNELAKGNPVIVLIKVRTDKNWLHYVPVVGFDECYVYLAESMEEYARCREKHYNRRVEIMEFKKLWNTSMLKMPFYKNTYFTVEKENENLNSTIIERYNSGENPVKLTHSFLKEFLNPTPDRYDMTYRYEHTLRVAQWGKKIAEGEGWNPEALVMACLLHDVGYPLCKDMADMKNHPRYSAELARKFLKQIGYEETMSERICKAIEIHDMWNDVPEDAKAFELSVRDADDLERFDVMRVCMIGRSDIGERSAAELLEICEKRLDEIEGAKNRICGTETAKKLWEEELEKRKQFYGELKRQMKGTFEMQSELK